MYPSESMILAGALNKDRGEPQPSIQVSKIQAAPTAESTRIPLRTSTDKREASNQKEPLNSKTIAGLIIDKAIQGRIKAGRRGHGPSLHREI